MNVTEIWHILNEACHGKKHVYELACSCKGLPKETVFELADKIEADMHILGFDKKKYLKYLKKEQFKKRIKELNI